MLQSSLYVLWILLVIYRIDATNINEPLIDTHTTVAAHEQFVAAPFNETDHLMDTIRPLRNQNTDNRRSFVNYANVNIEKNDNTTAAVQMAKPNSTKLIASSGKVYNKNDLRKRKIKSTAFDQLVDDWKCPNISVNSRYLECGCDIPYTLRCSGDIHGLQQIANGLRLSKYPVSLLDCTLKNVTFLSDARIFENVSLHGLVISSGEIKRVHRLAFLGIKLPLQALGLPNNALTNVPSQSLAPITSLERLDLSNNRIKHLDSSDFLMLQNLSYLELSDNNISEISSRSFYTLKRLQTLKLNGNRLEFGTSIQAIGQSVNLKELDLSSNLLRGPLTRTLLPILKSLESLNLGTNLLTSIQTGAFESFPVLSRLILHHNQIDVLQDHAFLGLNSLQTLDLSYNGIVAVSGASLKHLSRLVVLNLTHNFLRALTADLVMPLPSLKELRLNGNDISMVAKNAFNGIGTLESLSLKDNPLSCDCSLKPFAEWLISSNISSKDQMGATCATPPHLEGATLPEVPLDSLNCNGNVNTNNNANVLQQLEIRSKENHLTFQNKFIDDIILKSIHLSVDYGLILTWNVMLNSREFSCDAIFVYKQLKTSEKLLDNLPYHCESNYVKNENIVNVILYDITQFTIGEKYRFCLVLVERSGEQSELVVGCSNITKLKQIENVATTTTSTTTDRINDHFSVPMRMPTNQLHDKIPSVSPEPEVISDISSFKKITDLMQNDRHNDDFNHEYTTAYQSHIGPQPTVVTSNPLKSKQVTVEKVYASQLMNHINDTFMPSLSIGVLITSICAFIWAATKITHNRRAVPSTVCYAADQHSVDIENSNRYLKLQATTTL